MDMLFVTILFCVVCAFCGYMWGKGSNSGK